MKPRYNEETQTAQYVVRPDDVILLAAKNGLALTRAGAVEWLRENAGHIEQVIDRFIVDDLFR